MYESTFTQAVVRTVLPGQAATTERRSRNKRRHGKPRLVFGTEMQPMLTAHVHPDAVGANTRRRSRKRHQRRNISTGPCSRLPLQSCSRTGAFPFSGFRRQFILATMNLHMYQGSIYLLHKIERALKIFISDFYRPDGTTAVRVMPTK